MKRALALPALAAVAWSVLAHPLGWAFALGVRPYPAGTPWTYQMWSGVIPALSVLTLFGSVLSVYHLHNCHADGCWRLGRHRVNGVLWCARHLALVKPAQTDNELLAEVRDLLARIAAQQ